MRRHDVVLAGLGRQEGAEPTLRQTQAVVRRGVEVPDAAVPRGLEELARLVVADQATVVPDVGGAVAEAAEPEVSHRR
jgi:hypothetical protein